MDQKRLDSRYFPLVLDVVDQGIFTVDPSGLVTSFNKAAERITGFREEEVLGRRCDSIFRTNLCKTVCPLRRSIATGERAQNGRVRIHRKDGQAVLVALSTAPLKTGEGQLLGGVEVFRDISHVEALKRKLDGQYQFEDIVSRNPAMNRIFQILPAVSESTSTILITGASGTGKELVAKAIHNHGARRRRPFVAVNCAALPETLLESELFGYRRGAFTDAKRDKAGRIAQAEGGTLFLDEVGDLPKSLQVKLLRFLQEKSYEPLGSNLTLKADVRVITATHRDLDAMVREGGFREDLFFRLNVLQITLPALSKRPEDIPLLVRHFIQRFREATGKPILDVTPEALSALLRYDYPGNIRELENLIERAFILCNESEIQIECLPPHVAECAGLPAKPAEGEDRGLVRLEVEAIRAALASHANNRSRAAKELGIHRSTLLRKMRRYGLLSPGDGP
ncbi:MAG: sigma 54-interacting transcriptional regulator [Acidobacteriota bacterium]